MTVHQALKHPWITGRDKESPALPLPSQGHGMFSPDTSARVSGSGSKNSSNRKKKDSIGPSNTAAKTTPKPHIGTVPLFLVKKQPTVRSSASVPNGTFPATLHPSFDHFNSTPAIEITSYQPSEGGAPIFGTHGSNHVAFSAHIYHIGTDMPAAEDNGMDCVVEDIDVFSSDEEEERGGRGRGARGSNPQDMDKGRPKEATTAAARTTARKKSAPLPSIASKSSASIASSSSQLPRDGASPGPVSLFQMMKLNSMKWTKSALPVHGDRGDQEPTLLGSDAPAEGHEEAVEVQDLTTVPPGAAPITQFFMRQDAKLANHTDISAVKLPEEHAASAAVERDAPKRSLESSSHQANSTHTHANKRQKSLIEAWNIRTENVSPNVTKKRDHNVDAGAEGGEPLQKLASPSSSEIVCSPLTLSSGEKRKCASKRSTSSSQEPVGFHTEEFGNFKKLRKPKKTLSAVFK